MTSNKDQERLASNESAPFEGITRPPQVEDLEALRPILETWIRDRNTGELIPAEVDEVLGNIDESIAGARHKHYLVAESPDGSIVGVVGVQKVSPKMQAYSSTHGLETLELVNLYVDHTQRQKGIGRALVDGIQEVAAQYGASELIWNSGPRYREAWGFYEKLFGPPITVADNYYGEGGDAPVWCIDIEPQSYPRLPGVKVEEVQEAPKQFRLWPPHERYVVGYGGLIDDSTVWITRNESALYGLVDFGRDNLEVRYGVIAAIRGTDGKYIGMHGLTPDDHQIDYEGGGMPILGDQIDEFWQTTAVVRAGNYISKP